MTLRLDPPRRFGRLRIAVLSDCAVGSHPLPEGAGFFGRKRPAAILIDDGAGVAAFALDGTPLDLGSLAADIPGLDAAFAEGGRKQRR